MAVLKMSFDVWLGAALARLNLSGATLARRLSLPREIVYDWMHGLSLPESTVYPDLAEALGITISEVRRAAEQQPPLAVAEWV